MFIINTQGELVVIFPAIFLSLLGNSPQRVCVCSRFEHILFSLETRGNFYFLQVTRFVVGTSIVFKNEGYYLKSIIYTP